MIQITVQFKDYKYVWEIYEICKNCVNKAKKINYDIFGGDS